MDTQREYEILIAMKRYGGGFASRLAEAWLVADNQNRAKLRMAFPDLIEKYADMVEVAA